MRWVLSDRFGVPGARPLVLLHGAAGSARHWWWTVAELPPAVAAAAPDLPGHGATGGTVPDTVDDAVARVEAGLRELGAGPVALAGHSMGGLVALALAVRHPERVSHLALVATAARLAPHPELLRQVAAGCPDVPFIHAAFSPGVGADRLDVVVDDARRTRLGREAADYLGASRADLQAELGRIAAPTVVLVARGDPVVSPRRSRALAAAIPGARLVVLDGGHYLPIEQPGRVAAELTALLDAPGCPHRTDSRGDRSCGE